MAKHERHLRRLPLALAIASLAPLVCAQGTTLKPVTVTGRSIAPSADIAPFTDVPLAQVPASATVIDARQIEAAGARRLADLTKFDPSVADSYDAPGYWDQLQVRGFTLDNRYNYRREGLPINAETAIPLENKERVEILHGTSGLQAGVSAPGGLVNYVVKRPTESTLRTIRIEATGRASLLGAVDLGGRAGTEGVFGYRINLAHERLRPEIRNLDGERALAAFAGDWRIDTDSLLEVEAEWSRQAQPSQTGFSLLGGTLPGVPDPRLNLNSQPWLKTTTFDALAGTLRYSRQLATDWRVTAQAGTQRLKTNDYTAFPFGCGAEGNYDRFCSNGTYDTYDYRSENERRRQDAASVGLKGKLATGGVTHDVSFGLQWVRARESLPPYAYNYVGTGSIDGSMVIPIGDPTPAFTPLIPNERRRSVELSFADAIHWSPRWTTWLGLRHTSIATDYTQSLTTPWIAVAWRPVQALNVYASYGEGVESKSVPQNAAVYANPGTVLPALKSKQVEVGIKGEHGALAWSTAVFQIRRPLSNIDFCDLGSLATLCTGQFDGDAVHRGIEGEVRWNSGPWRLDAGAMVLRARREGSVLQPDDNGKRPPNVPDNVLRAGAAYRFAPALEASGRLVHEGNRAVLADNSVLLPAWTRLDAALQWRQGLGSADTTWTLGIDNITNRRYWKESPFQFSHVYLYAGAVRTWRLSMSANF